MCQAINDLESMHKLRGDLATVIENLQLQFIDTQKSIDTVAETWRDGQFLKFKEQFTEDQEKIKPLCEKLGDYDTEVLEKLERIIDEYLNL